MAAGTKIFLAIAALFIGGVVLYYGVLTPPADSTIQRDAEQPDDASASNSTPAEFRNELPPTAVSNTGWQSREDSLPFNPPAPVQDTLASDEPTPSWAPPRNNLRLADGQPMSDGGKQTPDGGFVGPPMPNDYGTRTLAANTPISTTNDRSGSLADQRIAAATRPPSSNTNAAPVMTTPVIRYTNYSVRSGDTLVFIAEDWFGDPDKWDLIVEANPDLTNPNRLQVGQLLKLPPRDTVRTAATPAQKNGGGTYIVKSGDSLSTISWKVYGEGSAWKAIYDANRSAIGSNPDRLKVGMKLTIPKRES